MLEKEALLQNKYIIYYDENYWYSWIYPEARRKIIDYLTSEDRGKQKFRVLNAKELKQWIEARIGKNKNLTANQTVIVFSQDMVPDVLAKDFSPSIILRSYLDEGGRIIWMGDIPFWRQGEFHPKIAKKEPHEVGMLQRKYELLQKTLQQTKKLIWNEWRFMGIFSILGLNAEFNYSPVAKVTITNDGETWGLRKENGWYGTRPIQEGRCEKLKVLAESSAKKFRIPELLKPEERKKIVEPLKDFQNLISAIIGLLSIVAAAAAYFFYNYIITAFFVMVVLYLFGPKIYRRFKPKKYANAWVKNFNSSYPDSGFVRLWDFQLYEVTKGMLEDLFKVATHGLEST